jgi:hypothetical protein
VFVYLTEAQAELTHDALANSRIRGGDDGIEDLLDLFADEYRGNSPAHAAAGVLVEKVIGLYRAEADITDIMSALADLVEVTPAEEATA